MPMGSAAYLILIHDKRYLGTCDGLLRPRLGEALPGHGVRGREGNRCERNVVIVGTNAMRGGTDLPDEMLREVPPLLTVGEFCAMTGMHPVSVRRALGSGRIPGDKVNGHWVIPGAFVIKNSIDYMRARERADAEFDNVMAELTARAERDAEKAERDSELAQATARMARRRALELRRRAAARPGDGRGCGDGDGEDSDGLAGALCLA